MPHDVWNQTKEENLKIIKESVKQMSEKFPGIPIFPALGNHESAPVNRYLKMDESGNWQLKFQHSFPMTFISA